MRTKLIFKDEKKHSVRYDADPKEENPCVTSIYVLKAALTKPYAETIYVSIVTN